MDIQGGNGHQQYKHDSWLFLWTFLGCGRLRTRDFSCSFDHKSRRCNVRGKYRSRLRISWKSLGILAFCSFSQCCHCRFACWSSCRGNRRCRLWLAGVILWVNMRCFVAGKQYSSRMARRARALCCQSGNYCLSLDRSFTGAHYQSYRQCCGCSCNLGWISSWTHYSHPIPTFPFWPSDGRCSVLGLFPFNPFLIQTNGHFWYTQQRACSLVGLSMRSCG